MYSKGVRAFMKMAASFRHTGRLQLLLVSDTESDKRFSEDEKIF